MKKLLTVTAIMICACLTQGFTPTGAVSNNHPASGKPAFNYAKCMRYLWLDLRKSHGVRLSGSLEIRNWNDSWATINYIYLKNENFSYFQVLLHDWESPIEEGDSRQVFYDTSLPSADLVIGLTVTGPTSNGERAIWVEDGNFNNLQ